MKNRIYLGLVHFPVYDRYDEIVNTSITNLDIHDISRTCRSYGVKKYYIINKALGQKTMFDRIKKFWSSDIAEKYNPDRVTAMSIVEYEKEIEGTIEQIKNQEKEYPIIVTTTACERDDQTGFNEVREIISENKKPMLLLFGTGNGLIEEIHKKADIILKPIKIEKDFNHLSVRSAVAIILDRLVSER